MHAGTALWHLYALLARINDNSPSGKLGYESLEVLSQHIKVALPNAEQLKQVMDYHDSIGAAQEKPTRSEPRTYKETASDMTVEAREALDMCNYIIDKTEDLPDEEKANAYGESLSSKACSMRDSILQYKKVTGPMFNALAKMKAGLDRWFKE